MEDSYYKDYYQQHKAFILDLKRNKYASDEEYRQKSKENAQKRYRDLVSTEEGSEAYRQKTREYVRRHREKMKKKK